MDFKDYLNEKLNINELFGLKKSENIVSDKNEWENPLQEKDFMDLVRVMYLLSLNTDYKVKSGDSKKIFDFFMKSAIKFGIGNKIMDELRYNGDGQNPNYKYNPITGEKYKEYENGNK